LQNQETTVSQTVPGMHSQNLLTITHGRGDFSQLLLFFLIFFCKINPAVILRVNTHRCQETKSY